MEENEHVKTAIRWHQRPNDDDVIIQQVNEKVSQKFFNDLFCIKYYN